MLEIQNGGAGILQTGASSGPFVCARTHQIVLVAYGFLRVRLPSHNDRIADIMAGPSSRHLRTLMLKSLWAFRGLTQFNIDAYATARIRRDDVFVMAFERSQVSDTVLRYVMSSCGA